jgi:peptidoglycan L-alanyl-D-glutamate endopeptidase CwlK
MINSRSLDELIPQAHVRADKLIELCKAAGIDLLVTSTYRDNESQDALYAQGRTAPGKIVTKAKGGQSFHNYRCAFDVVPIVHGKPVWDDNETWQRVGRLGKQIGLEWAGDWVTFKEYPHFQYTGGITIKQLQAGEKIV